MRITPEESGSKRHISVCTALSTVARDFFCGYQHHSAHILIQSTSVSQQKYSCLYRTSQVIQVGYFWQNLSLIPSCWNFCKY